MMEKAKGEVHVVARYASVLSSQSLSIELIMFNKDLFFQLLKSLGKRKKQDLDDIIPPILEPEGSSKTFRGKMRPFII